jgi:hypothetical protein
MRILKPLLIAAVASVPFAAFARTGVVERTYINPHPARVAAGVPTHPRSMTWIVPLRTEDVMQSANAGAGSG